MISKVLKTEVDEDKELEDEMKDVFQASPNLGNSIVVPEKPVVDIVYYKNGKPIVKKQQNPFDSDQNFSFTMKSERKSMRKAESRFENTTSPGRLPMSLNDEEKDILNSI